MTTQAQPIQQADPAEQILRLAQGLDDNSRADAWDAFHNSANEDELAGKLQNMNLPQETKASLWDAKQKFVQASAQPAKPKQLQTGGMADILPPGTTATGISARPTGTRSAIDQKLGLWGPTEVGNWIQDVEADYRQGTSATWVGSLLKRLGAKGTEYGVSPGISTPLGGVIKLAHAGTQVGEHPIKAANELVSGVGELLGPAAVTQPEALPFIATAEIGSKLGYHTAKHFGADDDTAEFIANISGLTAGSHVVVRSLRSPKRSFLQTLWRRIVGLLN
jgi:hypothetical protein